jgi:alpha-1,3-glucosyltransferase
MTAPYHTVKNEVAPEAALQKSGDSCEIPTFLRLLPYGLLTSSLSFFLFSFQVHEKTILLPLMPMTLLLTNANFDSTEYYWGLLFNNVSVFRWVPDLAYYRCN